MRSLAFRLRDCGRGIALPAVVFLLILSFIWGWRESFRAAPTVFAIALVGALASGHAELGGSLRDAGFRLDTLIRAAAILAPVTCLVIAFTVFAGHMLGSAHYPSSANAWGPLGRGYLFGLAQQYVLLTFFYRRLERLLGPGVLAVIATALVFAIFHLPNPFLSVVTFFAGLLCAAVYQRAPNLWAIALAHGLISYNLYYALPLEITAALRVGPGYWAR